MYSPNHSNERKVIPIVNRKIMFSDDECLQESYCGFDPSLLTEESLDNLELHYLSLMDNSISQITDEYPIVKYSSENTDVLNYFIESITVAIVSGKNLSFDERFTPKEEVIDDEVIAYITNPFGASTKIYNFDLVKLLYQKPDLTVTKEGVLLFYTPTSIFATLDCLSCNIVSVDELSEEIKNYDISSISSIVADSDSTQICFETKEGEKVKHQLEMHLDLSSDIGVVFSIV